MSTRLVVTLVLCSALPLACATSSAWPPPYSFIHEGALPYNEVTDTLSALPFDRIELERTACFGTCPVYTVTMFRDGHAEFTGRQHSARDGRFIGKVSPFDYGRLCYLLEANGLNNFASRYEAPWTCSSTTYLRVWAESAAEPVVVEDYGGYGPVALWAVQEAIDSVAARTEWKAAP